ncbi:MAG: oligoendopeptidase [Firmicutes bacterium]|nr:oligoendopeptidase [Bacillota bacterium]
MLKMAVILPLVVGLLLQSNTGAEASAKESSGVPDRKSVPAESQWHVTDIFADDAAWQSDFDKLKSMLPKITEYKGQLASSPQSLADCLKLRDEIGILSGKLYGYARLHRDENSADGNYQALTGKMEGLLAETSAATAFIEPEILSIADDKLAEFRSSTPALKEYGFYFENLARQKKHVLSPAEEEILSRASEATSAPETVFAMLSTADMTFPEILDDKGQKTELSEGRYRSFITSQNRKVRQQAFEALFDTYNKYRNTFAATLNGNAKKDIFYAKTRKYGSVRESALETDNVPLEVYDNLITTVHDNLAPLHRYVALKKKALRLNEIHMYDLYTPLVRDVDLSYKYEDGLKLIQTALSPLGPEYLNNLNKGLTSGWVDVYENKGKHTGAYSWGVYGVHPFVLLNYNGKYEDVSTVAHEMGHAMHSFYSQANQPYATSEYSIFTAEVASTTNEVLLMDYMLKTTTDKQKRLYLINQQLENIRTTVYRQTLFAEFEKIIYEKAEQGDTLTADKLDSIWHELNVKYYGPDMVVDKGIDVEWARIPHFYSSFYVYQYVTGFSAATSLADQIIHEGTPAQERYLGFLKSGGSDYPINILKRAGVDMSSPKPIETTLNKFSQLLDDLEKIINQP